MPLFPITSSRRHKYLFLLLPLLLPDNDRLAINNQKLLLYTEVCTKSQQLLSICFMYIFLNYINSKHISHKTCIWFALMLLTFKMNF